MSIPARRIAARKGVTASATVTSRRRWGPAALAERIESAIDDAVHARSRLPPEALALEGLSSPAGRHLLNNLCRGADVNYLEIGTYKGATAVASSYGNPGRFTCVDNFAEFPHMGARAALRSVRRRFAGPCRFRFLEADCWSPALRRRLPRGVNVYFYDGAHGREDQYRAFTVFDRLLADTFITVVDDWNLPNVRAATRRAFADLRYRILHERELLTERLLRGLWFNGMLVAAVRKSREGGR